MTSAQVIKDTKKYVLGTYSRAPVDFVKGRGTRLWDGQGNVYLDFVAGVAVNVLGHAPRDIARAIENQSKRLLHTSNLYHNALQARLAKFLVQKTGLGAAFFCNSGAEANEAAIKLARYFSLLSGPSDRFEIIAMEGSFHGRTMGAISATGQKKYQQGFGPLLAGFSHVTFGDADALRHSITDRTCAVMLEPIQGESGVKTPPVGYLKEVRRICDEQGLLLILDEVQTGIGRTGRFLACQNEGVKPDMVTLAKGLGGGVPIGACLVSKAIASEVKPGLHGSTFGGNPLACRAALAVVERIANAAFLSEVRKKGVYFRKLLTQLSKKYSVIGEVRGLGLMTGCVLTRPIGGQVVDLCLKRGLIINSIQDSILRFVPPLTVLKSEIDEAVKILDSVFVEMKV